MKEGVYVSIPLIQVEIKYSKRLLFVFPLYKSDSIRKGCKKKKRRWRKKLRFG